MKISVRQLRMLIREVVAQEAGVPGKWFPYDGETVDPDEIELMGSGGLGRKKKVNRRSVDESALREGADLSGKKLKASSAEEFSKKYEDFFAMLSSKHGRDINDAYFVVSKTGFMSRDIPMVALQNTSMPVMYWDWDARDGRGELKYATSGTLRDKVIDASGK